MTLVSKTFELYGKTYTLESGELAKQATGATLVKQGDTTALVTVVVSKERKNYDFFPLTVDFNEKLYAAGRIPGGYLKREGRPTEKATLTARMIDRPIRPSFPDGFRNEVQIVATSLVADQVNPDRCHLHHGRFAFAHPWWRALRGPARLRAHRPQQGDRRVHREPHL